MRGQWNSHFAFSFHLSPVLHPLSFLNVSPVFNHSVHFDLNINVCLKLTIWTFIRNIFLAKISKGVANGKSAATTLRYTHLLCL